MTILDAIAAHKREEVAQRKATRPLREVMYGAEAAPMVRDFLGALIGASHPARRVIPGGKSSSPQSSVPSTGSGQALSPQSSLAPRVIAEVKRRSPSKGPLRPHLDPAEVAATYERNGAAAISVLTDSRFFGGSLADLTRARGAVSLPMLCKEFIVDPYQIYEAREAGADAVLLIAALLNTAQLREYRQLAAGLGMRSLVEVHNAAETDSALASGAEIVGINNRDLHTFTVDLGITRSLLPMLPPGIVTVSESGIHTASDREMMAELGVHALLVGEGLLTAPDLAAATREICGLSGQFKVQSSKFQGVLL